MLEQDSSIIVPPPTGGIFDFVPRQPVRPQTPYQVLRMLPKDATPAQQDSAIQAWFEPGEIHYSEQPDTLHLPGDEVPRDLKAVQIPQYYRENFFSADTLYHPELEGGRYGIAGDPIPYTIHNDHVITCILLACFLIMAFVMSHISHFVIHQAKQFIYNPQANSPLMETGNEIRFQLIFLVITSLLYALLYFIYVSQYVASTFILSSEYALLGIYVGLIMSYFVVRGLLYTAVNKVFFDSKKNVQLLESLLFITACEGVALFPLVLLMAYFQFSLQNVLYYCIFILVFVKILTFYKTYIIFFKQKEFFLQIILYFCALEMIPLAMLWSGLSVITDILKVNY